jgi:hypothetical protein
VGTVPYYPPTTLSATGTYVVNKIRYGTVPSASPINKFSFTEWRCVILELLPLQEYLYNFNVVLPITGAINSTNFPFHCINHVQRLESC